MSGILLISRGFSPMATLTTSLIVMRWELLSALMMFFASTMKIKLRQNSHHVMALMCGGVGVAMSCWFVTGLLGITLSMENVHNFMSITKEAFIQVMSQTPADWPMP
jgi:hypothetical protein